jgi:hypothetical protein
MLETNTVQRAALCDIYKSTQTQGEPMAQFDIKKLDTSDRIVVGMGLLTLICLFLPWYGASVYSVNGFGTSWGWIGAILIIAAAVYLFALRAESNVPKTSYGPGVMVLGLSLIGTIIVALRWITVPRGSYPGFSYGPQYGLFITVIAGIVQVILAFRLFKASGESVPWENKKS